MKFEPVLPLWILGTLAVFLIATRFLALRRLIRTADRTRRRPVVLRWSGVTVAALLLLAAATRPGVTVSGAVPASLTTVTAEAPVNVFFVVDRSVDSRVEDFADGASRIAGIRDDITALIDHYAGAQFAVISFSSSATLDWPLSDDVWSLKPFVSGLSTYAADSPGAMYRVNAAAADEILRTQLAQAMQRSPDSTNLVFYFGEGAGGSRAPQGGFELEPDTMDGGAVFGYGTTTGGPIPQRIENGRVTYAADAQTGVTLISTINEPGLRKVAGQLDVPYIYRQNPQGVTTAVQPVASEIGSIRTDSGAARALELYWVFALAAAALVLLEIGLTIRQFRRRRSRPVDDTRALRMDVAS